MAISTKFIPFLLLLLLPLFSLQIQARDSQFFSKVTHTNDVKETEQPTKVDPNTLNKENQQQEQDPTFIPQTQNTNYGLYGHQTGQLPPSTTTPTTTTNDLPYKTESEEYNNYPNTNYKYNNQNSYYYNKDAYDGKQQGRYPTTTSAVNNQNSYYNGANNYKVERQGMSDTRFLENGKYFHDINSDKYYPNQYENRGSVNVNPKNWQYENRESLNPRNWQYSSRDNYGNYQKQNSYEYNSMEGYQNDEQEFQDEQNEFTP